MYFNYIISVFVLHLLLASGLKGQEYRFSTDNKKALKNYARAEMAYREKNNRLAVDYLEKAVAADNNFIEAWLLLGDACSEIKHVDKAINAYETALRISPDFFPRAHFFIGNLKFQHGKYAEAIDHYQDYLGWIEPGSPSYDQVAKAIEDTRFADYCVKNPISSKIEHAGDRINGPEDDYVNFVSPDGRKMFLTRKEIFESMDESQLYIERFYYSERENGEWAEPDTVSIAWDEGLSIGGMNLSVDGRRMYFTGCNFPDGFGSCDIYFSFRQGSRWLPPMNMGTLVNSQWWDSQPIVSPNGKKIFFASRRAGGKGGSDIWMSVRLNSGKWSPPVNLGDSINTVGNEMAPFLHADGKTLYFTSDGHPGLGGSDFFISRKDETGRWSKARNLGYPVNTFENEINLFVSLDGKHVWFSSDRHGGEGKVDIYHMEMPGSIAPGQVVFVNGTVRDAVSGSPLRAFVELTDLSTGTIVDTTSSDELTGEFLVVLQPGNNYSFHISRKGYIFYSEHFSLLDTIREQAIEKDFLLSPLEKGVKFVLDNLFFDFDKAEIQVSSYPELDRLFELLRDNHSYRVRIGGHTDNVGEPAYNLKLSEQRAKAVFDYLAGQGIARGRMEYIGFGDTDPIAPNETPEGRAMNRRTEITLVK